MPKTTSTKPAKETATTKPAKEKETKAKNTSKKEEAKDTNQNPDFNLPYSMQVIPVEEFDPERIMTSDPAIKDVPPPGAGKYRTVKLRYKHNDGTQGPILLQLGEKYCYGVTPDNLDKDGQPRKDKEGNLLKMRNYQVSMPMHEKNGPNESEQLEIDLLDNLREYAQNYAVTNKKKLGKGPLGSKEISNTVKSILFRKKKSEEEIAELDEGDSMYRDDYTPQLYSKLIYWAKDKRCDTTFYGPGDKEMDPRKIEGPFFLIPTLQIDSLYIGDKISYQHQIYDGTVRFKESRKRERLAPKNTQVETETEGDNNEENNDNETTVNTTTQSDDESADLSSASE